MRTYLTESETLSQSTDILRKETVDLKNHIEVSTLRFFLLVDFCNVFIVVNRHVYVRRV